SGRTALSPPDFWPDHCFKDTIKAVLTRCIRAPGKPHHVSWGRRYTHVRPSRPPLVSYLLQFGVPIVSAMARARVHSSGASAGKAEAAIFSSICWRVLAPAITDVTPG